jgi:hypothetical protein
MKKRRKRIQEGIRRKNQKDKGEAKEKKVEVKKPKTDLSSSSEESSDSKIIPEQTGLTREQEIAGEITKQMTILRKEIANEQLTKEMHLPKEW